MTTPGVTPNGAAAVADSLRRVRDDLSEAVLNGEVAAGEFPARYSLAADAVLAERLSAASGERTRGYALIAVGGFGRSQLCPGSDLDLMLIHRGRPGYQRVAQSLWYGIWDEGIHLDHSVRTRLEARNVAKTDLKVILGLLDARLVAGDDRPPARLFAEIPGIWRKHAMRFFPELERSVAARHAQHGDLAFLLEPDLKQSVGGLRDLAALRALAAAFPEVGGAPDTSAVLAAERLIVSARVIVHARTGSGRDRLLLQDQDEVAALLAFSDADALMAAIAEAGRTIATTCDEGWRRVRRLVQPATPVRQADGMIEDGIVLRGGEVGLAVDARPADDPTLLARLAAVAARRDALLERHALERCAEECLPAPDPWPDALLSAFVNLLGTGAALVPVVEALDQRRLFELLIPEWTAVRNRPQRNAYHRYTVDRHLLEAVAGAGEHLGEVTRPDLLLVGALLHDLGKGYPGDHTEVGIGLAGIIGRRMGFPGDDVAVLVRLVAYHLLLPEFATRRDLDDPATALVVAKCVEDKATLEMLAALTEADSKATGTSAWGPWKSELVAALVARVCDVLDGRPGAEIGTPRPTPEQLELIAAGRLALRAHGRRVTVVAPDRPGLLATVAGVLALHGCNVLRASAVLASGAMAIETFDVEPTFDRLPAWERVEADVAVALQGKLAIAERLAAQDRTYAQGRRPATAAEPKSHVLIDNETSARATIIEVRAVDRLGLLHHITAALAEAGLDVVSALVDTLGHEVIDTFYVRDGDAGKLLAPPRLDEVTALLTNVITA